MKQEEDMSNLELLACWLVKLKGLDDEIDVIETKIIILLERHDKLQAERIGTEQIIQDLKQLTQVE